MICPHCKKRIIKKTKEKDKTEMKRLNKYGYSLREIETRLRGKGIYYSYSTIGRVLRDER